VISAPLFRVERGRPTADELAALTVALLLTARREPAVASPATWTHGRGGYLSPRSWARGRP
jgi:hypothetical protein